MTDQKKAGKNLRGISGVQAEILWRFAHVDSKLALHDRVAGIRSGLSLLLRLFVQKG